MGSCLWVLLNVALLNVSLQWALVYGFFFSMLLFSIFITAGGIEFSMPLEVFFISLLQRVG